MHKRDIFIEEVDQGNKCLKLVRPSILRLRDHWDHFLEKKPPHGPCQEKKTLYPFVDDKFFAIWFIKIGKQYQKLNKNVRTW
jgi:hypothetical protein